MFFVSNTCIAGNVAIGSELNITDDIILDVLPVGHESLSRNSIINVDFISTTKQNITNALHNSFA